MYEAVGETQNSFHYGGGAKKCGSNRLLLFNLLIKNKKIILPNSFQKISTGTLRGR
jgi:hypothetical protein